MLADALLGNYKTVARELGMTIDGGVGQDHLRIHGELDGRTVEMWFGTHATLTRSRFRHLAPIELRLAARGWLSRLFGSSANLGDLVFDKRFALKTGDREQVATLLSDEARRALVDVAKLGLHPVVERDRVELKMFSNGGGDAPKKILRLLRETARVGNAIDAAFARTAP